MARRRWEAATPPSRICRRSSRRTPTPTTRISSLASALTARRCAPHPRPPPSRVFIVWRVAFSTSTLDSHFSADFSPELSRRCRIRRVCLCSRARCSLRRATHFRHARGLSASGHEEAGLMNTRGRRWIAAAALVTMLNAHLGTSLAAAGQGHADGGDGVATATPIKHVIILIGENRTFDNVYGTYVPKHGQTVWNLLSRGIVNADGSPGPNKDAAE